MSWQKIIVETQTESIEAISNILMTHGAEGVEIDDSAELDYYQPSDATVMVKRRYYSPFEWCSSDWLFCKWS
ncbi:50S ribosomal protein L11 methyltransferase [Weissella paramesenteroides]